MSELSNIYVNGVDVIEWLDETENKKKNIEIEEIHKIERSQHYPYKSPTYKQKSQSGSFKRAIKLTDQQIRKEYGIMKKPLKNLKENIIWLIVNNGPISTEEIMMKLNRNDRNNVSAAVSCIWSKLGINHDVLCRGKHGRAYFYKVATPYANLSDEAIIEMYYNKQKNVPPLESDISMAGKKYEPTKHLNCRCESIPLAENNDLVQKIEKIIGQTLGVEIKVSGKIEFVIRIEK
ncbi:MAG: hypothetical protein WC143_04645 [Eubacteriales bacterium]